MSFATCALPVLQFANLFASNAMSFWPTRSGVINPSKRQTGLRASSLIVAMAANGALNAVTRKFLHPGSGTICAMKKASRERIRAALSRSFRERIHAWAHSSMRPGNAAEMNGISAPLNGKGERRDAVTDRAGPGVADRNRSALDWPVVNAAILSS